MKRIAVLGAAGFLGSHLCDELIARGDEVVGIDDLSSSSGINIEIGRPVFVSVPV